jgi:hypothetical protein
MKTGAAVILRLDEVMNFSWAHRPCEDVGLESSVTWFGWMCRLCDDMSLENSVTWHGCTASAEAHLRDKHRTF